ncbi:MAG TPA: energy transducer TonB [Bacteroidales bacterium]|nr:energy transducer TonB [Bacteroidales bacterium]
MSNKHNISDHLECFPEEILLKYINDELSNEESEAVEKHISHCEVCSDFIDGVLMLESTDSFLNSKEDINKIISNSISQSKNKRKLNPAMLRAVAAIALILVLSGSYLLINTLLSDKKISQIKTEDEIIQTVTNNEETEISGKNDQIAQTISESKETEKDEILKFPDSGILDIYNKMGYLSEKDKASFEKGANEEDCTKTVVANNETVTPSLDISTVSGDLKEKKYSETENYYGGFNNVLPEETLTENSGNILIDKNEQPPLIVDDLTVMSAIDNNRKISGRENNKQDRSNEGHNSRVSKQKEIADAEKELELTISRDERSADSDIGYATGNVAYAPAGVVTNQDLPTSYFETISFASVEEKPVYPGGYEALIKFVKENTTYPESEEVDLGTERVIVSFIIDTAGYVTNVNVLHGINSVYDSEAVRVIKMLPRWTPGKLNGKTVNVSFVYPVDFNR